MVQPHRSRYWLNAKTKAADPAAFAKQVESLCTCYAYVPLLHALGGHILSCDEMTGIQALERIAPTQPMQRGQVERREFEYIRHGRLSLIASFDVVTGQIVLASLGPTRTEADFAAHVAQTIDTDPQAVWLFIADQLNTHQSETLVHLVAQRCQITDELGVKGQIGVLRSMASRAAKFATLPIASSLCMCRSIRRGSIRSRSGSVSWCGFLIKRGNFTSLDDLRAKILAFVDYFNQTAHPFRWTYTGRPLVA